MNQQPADPQTPTVTLISKPTNDTALVRGVRTVLQALLGFVVGLFVTVWGVPGVPDAVLHYVSQNWVGLAAAFGVSTGITAFIWNLLRSDVKNF